LFSPLQLVRLPIPLAYEVIIKGGHAINPRGERYTKDNIKELLNMRDFMESLRSSGIGTGGPSALNSRDIQAFANQLDRFLVIRVGKRFVDSGHNFFSLERFKVN
jgi:hypothetical protein